MLMIIEFVLVVVDLGMCAGHCYPGLLEKPVMIALDVVIATTHFTTFGYHLALRKKP